jgi:hypothetical protein
MTGLVDSFMKVLGDQPLSLALCAMNFILLYFLFKQGNEFARQRGETAALIIKEHAESQQLLANCVSKDIMSIVIAALERDRTLYRQMIQELGDNFSRPPPDQESNPS